MLVTDISDTDAAHTVLELLVNFWITICGFSFPSAWMELYKQSSKKLTTVKSSPKRYSLGIIAVKLYYFTVNNNFYSLVILIIFEYFALLINFVILLKL